MVADGDAGARMSPIILPGDSETGMLLIGDHASNHVPARINLGIDPALLNQHIAIDIGVDPLGRALCGALGCPGLLGPVSRLVIDLNREEDAPGLIPAASDGHRIPGNIELSVEDRNARIENFWRPYHSAISQRILDTSPKLLISLHSFTPILREEGSDRPWQVGVLYNRDERAAHIAIPLLEAAGIATGDNLPYSGKDLNATMNTHGEANGIAYLGLEVRQDLIGDAKAVARWAAKLAPIIAATRQRLA